MLPCVYFVRKLKLQDYKQPPFQSSLLEGSLAVSGVQDLAIAIGLLGAGNDLIVNLLVLQNLMGPRD